MFFKILPLLLIFWINQILAEECNIYVRFNQQNDQYSLLQSANNFIDESNVLLYRIDLNSKKVLEIKVPMQLENAQKCSVAYANTGKEPSCSGNFIREKVTRSVARNVLMTVGTLGIRTIKTGGVYITEINPDNIQKASQSVDVFNNPIFLNSLAKCNNY